METLSASPILCGENPPVIGVYPLETVSKRSFGSSFVVQKQKHMNKY